MSLTLVAVPIGNMDDITLRGLRSLQNADLYIGEERKPMFRLLKQLGIETPKNYELLNEHSKPEDVKRLAQLCDQQETVLITDCGTPGFSDPGADLVWHCRQLGIPVTSNPGPSSLTTFLSLLGLRLDQFFFYGFLPRDREQRVEALKTIGKDGTPTVIMDTPYRLKKTLEECQALLSKKEFILGMDFTKDNEEVLTGSIDQILKEYDGNKREFLLLIH